MQKIVLRRIKNQVFNTSNLLSLPLKNERVKSFYLSVDEKAFYNSLFLRSQLQFNEYLKSDSINVNYSAILVMLLRLRQACDHIKLVLFPFIFIIFNRIFFL